MSSNSATPVISTEAESVIPGLHSLPATQLNITREQTNGITPKPGAGLQHTLGSLQIFQHLPVNAKLGVDDLTRTKMGLLSGVDEEVKFALKRCLKYSVSAPYVLRLSENHDLLSIIIPFVTACREYIPQLVGPVSNQALEALQKGSTTMLLLRNLAQDSDNTSILANDIELKSFVLFILEWANTFNSEKSPIFQSHTSYFSELLIYTLDLMEAISSYIAPAKKDDLYFQNLCLIFRYTKDRYCVISILRSLSRLLVRSKSDEESAADNLDDGILNKIVQNLLIDRDEELIIASLDFLYQYILPGSERIRRLLSQRERYDILTTMLPVLLVYRVQTPDYQSLANTHIKLIKRVKPTPPAHAPELPKGLLKELFELNEPMRATSWLKCCFERSPNAEVTQILLWKTYEQTFSEQVKQTDRKLITAVDFIKNVSNALPGASALVVVDEATSKKKFVIRGIQPRRKALTIDEANKDISQTRIVQSDSESDGYESTTEASQIKLPDIQFPNKLSEVSKASASFLSLLSNDTTESVLQFIRDTKPAILHRTADVPPLNEVLADFIHSTSI
ncbi:Chromatin structure-remodeling complex subunit RSC9 [Kluyveromyces marxianus]|uniref:Chromatin structure-remodeling complex subunit RSC9 n=2 Tax=Kluyveromyces marxianus TaxID=4911 RepID=W0TF89_KLUMD|nr:chromatin structure-remodeling complex subunit RSC9 [Kluyveromyces marxianus DMKU3-1042]QGN17107.1 chromatin structure-remodeling complex subunit RSC9 [Kluyveromyces marxianus]BAO41738.1 chromatin structure-remodeling complex subunit RSC9 [Kluyveromyces marxianus DMKU3-1042]BAP73182.1 chromatin structure-remodeling complex subunit RSC9 [Kluyveromyces marxianus]